jgi:hypothetical protein
MDAQAVANLRKRIAALKARSCGMEKRLTGAVTRGGAFGGLLLALKPSVKNMPQPNNDNGYEVYVVALPPG